MTRRSDTLYVIPYPSSFNIFIWVFSIGKAQAYDITQYWISSKDTVKEFYEQGFRHSFSSEKKFKAPSNKEC